MRELAPLPGLPAAERPTRKRLDLWDRFRILGLLAVIFGFFLWRKLDDNPLLSFDDALRETWRQQRLVEILFGVEVLRQLHYLVSERSARWHHLVTESTFGRWNRWVERRRAWTRYRAGRVFKALVFLTVLAFVLGAMWDRPPLEAIADAPGRLFRFLFGTATQLPFIFQMVMILFIAVGQFVAIFWFLSRGGVEVFRPDEIKERFADVKGQDPVLREVTESVAFLEHPRAIEERGGRVPKGILLWGPPGTGKTLMAKAVAGETSKPFVFIEPAAFTNMFLGVGVLKVRALYKKLRKLSLKHDGVIAFFDEADSLGNRGGAVANATPVPDLGCTHWAGPAARQILGDLLSEQATEVPTAASFGGRVRGIIMGGMGMGGGGFGTVQALLTEMDGLTKPRGWLNRHLRRFLGMMPRPPLRYRILHMMATNLPSGLDPAFLRPGRIDRIYHVGRPRSEGREQTYRYYLGKVRHELSDDQIHRLAVISDRGTGASIADIVNEAVIVALRNGHDAITYQDILRARYLKEHGPPDDFGYSDWEGHAVAVHEACHALAMYRLRKRDEIDVATIERRGEVGGFVAPIPLEEQFVSWRSEIDDDVKTFLASLAGERLFFDGDNSQGVGGDLGSSTAIVLRSFAYHGMGGTVSSMGGVRGIADIGQPALDGTDRQFMETDLGRRVEAHLQRLLDEVRLLLEADRHHVLAVAHALETHKTINGEDIVAIIEGGRGPTVDGAAYHDPVVRAELETYHAAVMRAMQDRGRVEHALPVLVGAAVEPVALFGPPAVPPTPPPNGQPPPPSSPPPPSPNGGGVDYPQAPPVEG